MSHPLTRRRFLHATGAGLSGVLPISWVWAEKANTAPDVIRFGPDLEPIVRLIEETPREKCVAVLTEQLRDGLPYRRFLAAIFFAAIRKRNPHHSVYLVNSAHQVSLDLRPQERLLPMFWAVDHFKWQQEVFPTPAVERLTGPLPAADKAAAEFHDAMQRLDSEHSERATIALARSEGARQAFGLFWHYGCRDSSFIGHRAIGVANCWRALETIGWQHAEPVLRTAGKVPIPSCSSRRGRRYARSAETHRPGRQKGSGVEGRSSQVQQTVAADRGPSAAFRAM